MSKVCFPLYKDRNKNKNDAKIVLITTLNIDGGYLISQI